jgi:hypothetical protein
MADQFIQGSGWRQFPTQPALIGIALDQAALLQQPANALAQLSPRIRPTVWQSPASSCFDALSFSGQVSNVFLNVQFLI